MHDNVPQSMSASDWLAFTPLEKEVYAIFSSAHPRKQTPEKILLVLNSRRPDVRNELTLEALWHVLDAGALAQYVRRVDRFRWKLRN